MLSGALYLVKSSATGLILAQCLVIFTIGAFNNSGNPHHSIVMAVTPFGDTRVQTLLQIEVYRYPYRRGMGIALYIRSGPPGATNIKIFL